MLGIVSSDLMTFCIRDMTGLEMVLSGFFSSIGIWPNHEVTEEMRSRAWKAMEHLEVTYLAERFTDQMSSGEGRRLLLARALVHTPRALILDEPSTALDLFAQHELRTTLRKLARSGIGIVMVTHHLSDLIPEIQRVILMQNGRSRSRRTQARDSHGAAAVGIIRAKRGSGGAGRVLQLVVSALGSLMNQFREVPAVSEAGGTAITGIESWLKRPLRTPITGRGSLKQVWGMITINLPSTRRPSAPSSRTVGPSASCIMKSPLT